ncbi:hypothetical protein R9X47_00845 [Wukongibacter baidiensis]|uniref:hypothetical protein n=1 Tax=Wukongibacter baidiensis TaxID=1723361 RepID=UPI003D7F1F7C
MIICVTAFKKNIGQTTISINLGSVISNLLNKEVLIVDSDTENKGVEKYLSNSNFCKGLDEFVNFRNTGMLDDNETFKSCVKEVNSKIHIMASNHCTFLNDEDVRTLKYYSNKLYPLTLVDTVRNDETDMFLNYSDLIIVSLTQDRKAVLEMLSSNIYQKYSDKVIFVINKYITKLNDDKVYYTKDEIIEDLKKNGFYDNEIFTLDFDINIINEVNDFTILNSINIDTTYINGLKGVSKHILCKYLGCSFEDDNEQIDEAKGGILKWIFPKRLLNSMK